MKRKNKPHMQINDYAIVSSYPFRQFIPILAKHFPYKLEDHMENAFIIFNTNIDDIKIICDKLHRYGEIDYA